MISFDVVDVFRECRAIPRKHFICCHWKLSELGGVLLGVDQSLSDLFLLFYFVMDITDSGSSQLGTESFPCHKLTLLTHFI